MTPNPSLIPTEAAPVPPRKVRVFRRIQVIKVNRLTPHMVRVSFTGDDLAAFGWNGPAAHIKLIFPEDGQTEPTPPQPDGPRPNTIRTYTPRRFDPVFECDQQCQQHEGAGRQDREQEAAIVSVA